MVEVVKLTPKADPREIISLLETALEEAKAGKIEAVVLVCLDTGSNDYDVRSSGMPSALKVIGALATAQHDTIMRGHQ